MPDCPGPGRRCGHGPPWTAAAASRRRASQRSKPCEAWPQPSRSRIRRGAVRFAQWRSVARAWGRRGRMQRCCMRAHSWYPTLPLVSSKRSPLCSTPRPARQTQLFAAAELLVTVGQGNHPDLEGPLRQQDDRGSRQAASADGQSLSHRSSGQTQSPRTWACRCMSCRPSSCTAALRLVPSRR